MGWEGRKRRGGRSGGGGGEGEMVGREGERKGRAAREGEGKRDVEGPRKWSAPGPALALGGPGFNDAPH